jgi:HlyD family secretion protein
MAAPTAEERELNSVAQTTDLGLGKIASPEVEGQPPGVLQPHKGAGTKRWRKPLLLGIAALALIGLVVGGIVWSKRGVVKVQTGKVQRQDLSSIVTASGEVKPVKENLANVNANTFGRVDEILIKEGDTVKKGQLLLKTESVQQVAQEEAQAAAVKNAQADIEGMQATVQSTAASLKSAQADLQTAQANFQRAKDDYARGQQLLEDNLIARNVYDQRLNDYKVAQANVDAAQARVAQQKANNQQAVFNLDMARARLAQAKANLIGAQDLRRKTEYYSPLTGIVTSLPVHVGENVVPGIQNTVGSLLYQVSDLAIMTAEVKVDETDIINVKLGQPADVLIDAVPNKTFKAKVTEIGQSAVGRTSGQTSGTSSTTAEEAKDFNVVVTLSDPPPTLRPGLSATAKITTATRQNAVTIPIQALTVRMKRELEEPAKGSAAKTQAASAAADASAASSKEKEKGKEEIQGVFAVRKGEAVFVPLETGIMGTTDVEVVKGLQPNDVIVTGPFSVLRTLKNHTKVTVDNTGLTPGGPAA